ncbi:MAG: hypothetical protein WCS86_03005 [Candidatus Paceibacterota bacterium]
MVEKYSLHIKIEKDQEKGFIKLMRELEKFRAEYKTSKKNYKILRLITQNQKIMLVVRGK